MHLLKAVCLKHGRGHTACAHMRAVRVQWGFATDVLLVQCLCCLLAVHSHGVNNSLHVCWAALILGLRLAQLSRRATHTWVCAQELEEGADSCVCPLLLPGVVRTPGIVASLPVCCNLQHLLHLMHYLSRNAACGIDPDLTPLDGKLHYTVSTSPTLVVPQAGNCLLLLGSTALAVSLEFNLTRCEVRTVTAACSAAAPHGTDRRNGPMAPCFALHQVQCSSLHAAACIRILPRTVALTALALRRPPTRALLRSLLRSMASGTGSHAGASPSHPIKSVAIIVGIGSGTYGTAISTASWG